MILQIKTTKQRDGERDRTLLTASISQTAVNHTSDENLPGDLVSLYRRSLEQKEEKKKNLWNSNQARHRTNRGSLIHETKTINHRYEWMWQVS